MVVAEWWWLVVVEQQWPLSLSDVVGLAAKWEVVVFGWLGCVLLVVGGMLEVVVAVRAVVIVGRWQRAAEVTVVRVVACCWAV